MNGADAFPPTNACLGGLPLAALGSKAADSHTLHVGRSSDLACCGPGNRLATEFTSP